jgi:AraC-like DNA-binding protein
MSFQRISPPEELRNIIECYWIVENNDPSPVEEKIIPDGFAELIFHYGDPYLIRLTDQWEVQSKNLYAGQISRFFYLKNSRISRVLGVKLKPAALTQLYNISADRFTDKVVGLSTISEIKNAPFQKELDNCKSADEKISILNRYFYTLSSAYNYGPADRAVELILSARGVISVSELCAALYVSERQLERIFRQYIGLSPKYYCRIIQFNYIFQCIQNKDSTWMDIVHDAGYYDQSHFIRNFKAFTGEEPSSYVFEKENLANFFLIKKAK